ncbi:MAG: hypothetical protein KTR31_17265 [Myxococcales bacterium]|nr:hypothetical protein [Myxococcales bacterium]
MQRGLPLSTLITGVMLALIVAVTAAVGWTGFVAAQNTVDELWRELADSVALRTTTETLRFLEDAVPHTRLTAGLIEQGVLDPTDRASFLTYLEHASDAHRAFTWVSWGDARDGTFLGTFRPSAERLQRRLRFQLDAATTESIDEERTAAGWTRVPNQGLRYDPRERPWFTAARERPRGQGVWIDPYPFHGRDEAGVTYSMPVRDRVTDALLGVVCVDFELAPLSQFLGTLRVAEHGRAYVLTADGMVVAHPEGQVIRETDDGLQFWSASAHPDAMLAQAFAAQQALPDPFVPFAFGEHLAVATPFPSSSGIPWVVLTVVPRDDLLGHAEEQAIKALAAGLVAMIVAVALGSMVSRLVLSSVRSVRGELLRVARLDLQPRPRPRSAIRELDEMGSATETMKQGLQAFERYVPRQLVRRVLESGQAARLGAERKELSVLFTDIESFTSVVEATPPDEVLEALGRYLQGMNAAIHACRGTVAQYLGDGIMAFWGAPEPLEDHAVHACLAALAMHQHSETLVAQATEAGTLPFPTRFGIDTGQVMVGNIGALERFSYGILGDTVNIAARLEDLNKVYGTRVIAGSRTVQLARPTLLFRPLDRVLLKGKTRPVLVYEVVGVREQMSDEVLSWVASHTRGLEAYFERRFDDARAAFAEVLEHRPDDGPATLMTKRCTAYLTDPPPTDWGGASVPHRLERSS